MSAIVRFIQSVFSAREAAAEISEPMDLSDDALTCRELTRGKIVSELRGATSAN